MAGSAFYAVFGRLQYNTNATQEVCAILYGAMAQNAAVTLRKVGRADQIQPTILALIVSSTMLTGICSVLLGKLGVGKLMLRFPTPVTSGFLGTIGFFLVRTALQVSSGVQFVNFYPVDFGAFFSMHSLAPVICLMVMVALIRNGPSAIAKAFPNSKLLKLSGLFCQLCPLGLFYIVVCLGGFSMGTLSKNGWTYPTQASRSFASLWTTYDLRDADVTVLLSNFPSMLMLVMMSVLCTMTGVLGITGKFRMGPDGDPAPMETVDFDAELTTVGFASIFAALSNGVVTFHRILLFYLQGQLFFGSGQTLASSLVEAIEQDLLGGAVMSEYCILSFGKVTSIDASAAEQLRMAVKRVSEHGCKDTRFPTFELSLWLLLSEVIFCRMNSQVFDALSTLKVVTAPDVDLRQTDALDYTGDRLLEKYLYQSSLKGYMLEYRNACSTGARLANEAFEAMNLLPEGFLTQIQPFCAIQMGLASGQRLAEDDAFCFVFQGAIAVVNELSDQKQTSQGVSIKGFQGRRQKRLRKRYPPGSIVGKHEFVLNSAAVRLCDTGTTTSRVVSSLSSH
ncbi:Uncharacterized vacuolar membrane protein YGR125W [Durusdinium trenchii]|uniref:Uncharacterized vacuolar membrane protein YGR125W n=1 Tax=Durusdinium trenchii TaxID=1381693 RepID=A0ABP0LI18_9DINO